MELKFTDNLYGGMTMIIFIVPKSISHFIKAKRYVLGLGILPWDTVAANLQ